MRQRFQHLGDLAEQKVLHYFENIGFEYVAKNFKKRTGEIDLIMKNQTHIVFIEVKYRRQFDDFENIIDDKKIEKIYNTIEKFFIDFPHLNYLQTRIDIVFIDKTYEINHVQEI